MRPVSPRRGRGGPATAALLFALALLAPGGSARAAVVPAGFEDTLVIGGLTQPVSFAFAPNGDLWVGEKPGTVKIVRGGNVIVAGTLLVTTPDEMGIANVAIDPDFAANGRVWIHRGLDDPLRQRVSRFTVVNDQLTSEVVVLEIIDYSTFHHAGALRFDAQGRLLMTTGDDGRRSEAAQDPYSLHGKVIRINTDGTPAAGNPFLGGGGDPRVLAMGFRNPYRFSIEPETGNIFVADVGAGNWEELNIIVPGGNYGWAEVEGFTPPGSPGFVYPIFAYPHTSPLGNSIIGGEHAGPGDLVPEYEGHYFYGDEAALELRRLVLDAAHNVVSDEVWATGVEHPVEIRFGPDGALYYAAFFEGSIRKVAFVGGANRAPEARATATPASGLAPLDVLLDGTASSDPDMDPLAYSWNTGDGGGGSTATLAHTYAAGVWEARLTVDDGQGATDQTPKIRIVSGNRAPTASITQPADESLFNAGDTILYSGTGSDPENGALPCARFTWGVDLRHLGHTHPGVGPIQGTCGGSFTIPQTGEPSPDIHYEFWLEVRDDGAPLGPAAVLTGRTAAQVRPNTAQFTLATAPDPGLLLTLDDTPAPAPRVVTGVVNFLRDIGAPSPQAGAGGRVFTFASWSDGGAQEHTIATPAAPATYSATFTCNVLAEAPNLRVEHAAGGAIRLTWDPVGDLCAASGPARYRVYAAPTAIPAAPPGLYPADPPFALAGTSATEEITLVPPAGDRFYLVVAIGTDGQDGPSGHYGD